MSRGYVPLRVDEQEALNKLIDEHDDLYVEVVGWGYHPSPEIIHGDRRIQIHFPMEFTKPDHYRAVEKFHLRLKTRDGETLYEDKLDVNVPGQDYVTIRSGVQLDLVWDLWIDRISDDLVDRLAPKKSGEEIMSVDHKTGDVDKTDE